MNLNFSSSVFKRNRRRFLKSQILLAVGACIAGVAVSQAHTIPDVALNPGVLSPDELLVRYQTCLGGPFPDPVPMNLKVFEIIRKDGYRITSMTYEAQSGIKIPALLLVPDGVTADYPAPAIAVWHQHNGEYHLEKSEPAGLAGNPMHHTGVALVRKGYVVLCPDALCFEERQDPTGKLRESAHERFEFLREVVRGRSMA